MLAEEKGCFVVCCKFRVIYNKVHEKISSCSGHRLRQGLKPLDCWNPAFETRWWHGSSFLVFVVCCVGSGLCDGL